MNEMAPAPKPKASKLTWKNILLVVVLVLVFAYAVEKTQINLERPLDPNRQENVTRVLRLLADPDLVKVEDGHIVGPSESLSITITHIIETILMALMASTIGTFLAVPISFIAARNLMAPVTAPLAAIMAAVIAIPIGGGIGWFVGSSLMELTMMVSGQTILGLITAVILAAVAYALIKFGPALVSPDSQSTSQRIASIVRVLLAIVAGYLSLGILAQLGNMFGDWLYQNLGIFGFLGAFFTVIGDTLFLGLPALAAFLLALITMSYGSRYGQEAVLSLKGTPARILTGILTALGTAVIVYGIGSFLNWLYQFDKPQNWTTNPALVAGGLGLLVGLAVAPKRPFGIGMIIYNISRGLLNILRSIEPLIMGIVFVVWVSLGPFAGVMALTLHSIAALGKLFSEQVEGIDDGPVEAITATGANKLQIIVFGVIPQIIPPFIAFTLYRWDINVRMSTIIGFVGGGGIGFVLSQNIQQLRYRQASVMMLAIAIVVASLDYVSSKIRARII
jgi:phosphonate ABC transporter permease subunit PhnE